MNVPSRRVRRANEDSMRRDGRYVLYWMTSQRRLTSNFALDRALAHSKDLGVPLLVLEALRLDYPWASARLHRFVVEGMRDNEAAAARMKDTLYYPYVEPRVGAGKGLVEALAARAAIVVGDDFPCFFLPRMQAAAASRMAVAFELVDGNGLYPMAASDRVFTTAHSFRRHLQKTLAPELFERPVAEPGRGRSKAPSACVDPSIWKRWPRADLAPAGIALLDFENDVAAGAATGGARAARETLQNFLQHRLGRYSDERNAVEDGAASGLSPYLHFGHIGAHEVFEALLDHEGVPIEPFLEARVATKAHGSREGWWGLSPGAEAFLDEAVTWRELGYNFASKRPDYASYDALPSWALATLADHARDPRQHVYSLADFDNARTHDRVWNAAQRELVRSGRMHNYLRMLWGKKVLEWTRHPRDAAAILIELNNRYALDGRNPNSYSGIYWVFGRYDRAWGPERPIFGKVRYMSSESTMRKLDLTSYLKAYGS